MKIRKYLKVFLIIVPVLTITWMISPIEFTNKGTHVMFTWIIIISYFICAMIFINLLVFQTKEEKIGKNLVSKILFNTLYGSLIFIILFFLWFGWSNYKVNEIEIYRNINNPNIKIEKKSIGGGSWENDPIIYKTYKVTPLGNYFSIFRGIDTNKLIKNEWIKSSNKYH